QVRIRVRAYRRVVTKKRRGRARSRSASGREAPRGSRGTARDRTRRAVDAASAATPSAAARQQLRTGTRQLARAVAADGDDSRRRPPDGLPRAPDAPRPVHALLALPAGGLSSLTP